jgi:protocatechuate 3,4-dioxygenase beta subunit
MGNAAAVFRVFVLFLGSLMVSALASAQSSGVISGTVTDADNRPLPGVTVTLVSADDSVRRSIVTNANGRYEIANLATETYTVTAELPGFRAAVKRQRVTGGRREVWLVMEPGELPETFPGPARPPARIIPVSP